MQNVIVYGAGSVGGDAFWNLRGLCNILFYVDEDEEKQKNYFYGLEVFPLSKIKDYLNVTVVVASNLYHKEMINNLKSLGCSRIIHYADKKSIIKYLTESLLDELSTKRTIDIGNLLLERDVFIKELTFVDCGSGVLDYAFLRYLQERYKIKKYLEIGTYIGESINQLVDGCDSLYSITAKPGSKISMADKCKKLNIPDYSNRLCTSPKIKTFYADSRTFDYSQIDNDIGLYFIDGDHSYNGVFRDTKNVFSHRSKDSFVVWHDVKGNSGEGVIVAIHDVLKEEFKNVYCVDNNLCAVYIPEKFQSDFPLREFRYGNTEETLYVYSFMLTVGKR